MKRALFGLALLASTPAAATSWVGADWGGADLVVANGDTLTGTFTNVGRFVVPAGATARAVDGQALEIRATVVLIDGTLDATGAGSIGGTGAPSGGLAGTAGFGAGGGQGGFPGPCIAGGGGAGGGYGGRGGDGGFVSGATNDGGGIYGTDTGPSIIAGSGGGGSGSDCYATGEDGGAGGGTLEIVAGTILIQGAIRADGDDGDDHNTDSAGGGGGGSGGSVLLDTEVLGGNGIVSASGGDGGETAPPPGLGGGGGGGGGGRIKVFYAALVDDVDFLVDGGQAGSNQDPGYMTFDPQNGLDGSVYLQAGNPDSDADGVLVPDDNCPTIANPSQANSDGDGYGDDCDPCPDDPFDDSDYDGVCDGLDVCPGGDDARDTDGDGVPNDCDPCPEDDPDDSDDDGVCDANDVCPGLDDSIDTDGDEVPDACDTCPDDPDPDQRDIDGDGLGDGCDCGPLDPNLGPDAMELCDGIDNNCDGEIDELGAEGGTPFYADTDNDGQGDADNSILACTPPPGYVDNALDCDDTDRTVLAFGIELCDGIDNDCDGEIEPPDMGCDPSADEAGGGGGCGCDEGAVAIPWLAWILLPLVRRRRGR